MFYLMGSWALTSFWLDILFLAAIRDAVASFLARQSGDAEVDKV